MMLWDVPTNLEVGVIPKKLYCNKIMVAPLEKAFENVIERGLIDQIKTFDGCFNIRKKKGAPRAYSLHAWGIAIDINAAWNGWMKPPTMSNELVQCFKDAGFEWGGDWKNTPDGMHYEISKL